MTQSENQAELSGLRFFGRVSASIAHDIRNVIAVISESGGLLEDLCLMAEKGPPLDPARLKRVAGNIKDQVRRGERILTTMSRFAHSVDETSFAEIDATELLDLLTSLSTRFAAMQGVAVQAVAAAGPVMIKTLPFVMLNLLWRCLEYAMSVAGPGKRIVLSVEKPAGAAGFRFSGLEGLPQAAAFPAPEEETMSQALKARVRLDPRAGALTVLTAAA